MAVTNFVDVNAKRFPLNLGKYLIGSVVRLCKNSVHLRNIYTVWQRFYQPINNVWKVNLTVFRLKFEHLQHENKH